ncbi:hypothetical protein V1512DRAFT_50534 [Lipomyces arxii]|uniref:uncharacterized protein n=1 Tax=Lipomyces arxii TaxID=56418 RepID=UPI0034CFEEAA
MQNLNLQPLGVLVIVTDKSYGLQQVIPNQSPYCLYFTGPGFNSVQKTNKQWVPHSSGEAGCGKWNDELRFEIYPGKDYECIKVCVATQGANNKPIPIGTAIIAVDDAKSKSGKEKGEHDAFYTISNNGSKTGELGLQLTFYPRARRPALSQSRHDNVDISEVMGIGAGYASPMQTQRLRDTASSIPMPPFKVNYDPNPAAILLKDSVLKAHHGKSASEGSTKNFITKNGHLRTKSNDDSSIQQAASIAPRHIRSSHQPFIFPPVKADLKDIECYTQATDIPVPLFLQELQPKSHNVERLDNVPVYGTLEADRQLFRDSFYREMRAQQQKYMTEQHELHKREEIEKTARNLGYPQKPPKLGPDVSQADYEFGRL